MQRVLIIGSGGAGKSTLARIVAARAALPLVHLDALYWHPGWRATPDDEWDARIAEIVARDRWVMDGNYGRTLPQRLAFADTVIFLDMSRVRCVARIVKRWWRYRGHSRPDLPQGCPEQLSWEFVWWVWTYPARRRASILAQLTALPPSTHVHVLRTPADVQRFVERLTVGA